MHDIPITISIVTFKDRFELVKELIQNIRSFEGSGFDILLSINGNNEEETSEDYRSEILNFCAQTKRCYPFFYPEFKSLCKLWNQSVISSRTDYNFIICDDVSYLKANILNQIKNCIAATGEQFFKINNEFSHFVVTKKALHEVGYFDERFIAHGEEDGDMIYRYQDLYKKSFPDIYVAGLQNLACYDLQSANVDYIDRKPTVNKKIHNKKYEITSDGVEVMTSKIKKIWKDEKQYPYEMFVLKNKHNIKQFTDLDISYD